MKNKNKVQRKEMKVKGWINWQCELMVKMIVYLQSTERWIVWLLDEASFDATHEYIPVWSCLSGLKINVDIKSSTFSKWMSFVNVKGWPFLNHWMSIGTSPVVIVHVTEALIPSCRLPPKLKGIIVGATEGKRLNKRKILMDN